MQTHAMQYGISYKYNQDFSGGNLTNFDMNLGMFLASRGPYAWLGCACLAIHVCVSSMSVCHPCHPCLCVIWCLTVRAGGTDGWMGCGCGWEHNGKMPCDIYQRPAALDVD